MEHKPPYVNTQNNYYLRPLFYEQAYQLPKDMQPFGKGVFTLHADIPGLINMGKAYVHDKDPTGYTTAMKLLGSWRHWEMLNRTSWFAKARESWDAELDAKLKSKGVEYLIKAVEEGERDGLQAAKFLASQAYKSKTVARRGRPDREEVAGELKREAEEAKSFQEDLSRISLKAVK